MTSQMDKPDYDAEELALLEIVEREAFEAESVLSREMAEAYREAARNTLNEGTERVQLRIARTDLARLKAKALGLGIPYQTYIKSVLHRDVS